MKLLYIGALFVLSCILVAGCLNAGTVSEKMEGSQGYSPADAGSTSRNDLAESGSSLAYPTMVPTAGSPASGSITEQKLIKTGSLTLEVKAVPDALTALKGIAEKYGGYLSSSSLYRGQSDRLSASVTVRVPATAFDAVLGEIHSQGRVLSESVNAQDVTEEYIDLSAQQEAKRRQLEQYNRILEKAEKIEDILKIQIEIERVQVEIDRLEGRLRYLENRADLGTLTVYLQEPAPIGGDSGHDFVSVINEGIQGFLSMVETLVILLFTLLPLIILGALGYWVYRWRKRSHHDEAPEKPEPPAQ